MFPYKIQTSLGHQELQSAARIQELLLLPEKGWREREERERKETSRLQFMVHIGSRTTRILGVPKHP